MKLKHTKNHETEDLSAGCPVHNFFFKVVRVVELMVFNPTRCHSICIVLQKLVYVVVRIE